MHRAVKTKDVKAESMRREGDKDGDGCCGAVRSFENESGEFGLDMETQRKAESL